MKLADKSNIITTQSLCYYLQKAMVLLVKLNAIANQNQCF